MKAKCLSLCLAAGSPARANHAGTFVWSDNSSTAFFPSSANNQFLIRAKGGVGIDSTQDDSLPLLAAGSVRVHVSPTGSVGIGTIAPSFTLHVNGGASNPAVVPVTASRMFYRLHKPLFIP